MRPRSALPLLAGAFLLASPVLRAEEVEIGTWAFKTDRQVTLSVAHSAGDASEEERENQGFFRVDQGGEYWILVNKEQLGLGKGGGLGRLATTRMKLPGAEDLRLKAIFREGARDLDQVLQVQVGTYAPFQVWLHRQGAGNPIQVELGDGKTPGPAVAKVRIHGGDLTYTD